MAERSTYPSQIDTDTNLPSVRDGATSIRSSVFNAFKSAIIAIEKTLGVNPQGNQITVSDRLNVSMNADGSLKPSAVLTTIISDRNAILTGGGNVSWSALTSALSWSTSLELRLLGSGGIATTLSPSTVFLIQVGDILYVEPSRTGANPIKPPQTSNLTNNTLNAEDIFVLAVRDTEGNVVFRDGTVIPPERTATLGSTTADKVTYDNGVSGMQASDVKTALDILDGYAQRVDRDRNLTLTGDAYNIDFDSGTGDLSWQGDFIFSLPNLPANAIIRDSSHSPINFPSDQSAAFAKIQESQTSDYLTSLYVVEDFTAVPYDSYSTLLAIRSGGKIHLRNNQVIYNPTQPVRLGEQSANHIVFDDSLVPFSATDVNSAIETSHTTLQSSLSTSQADLSNLTTAVNQDRDTFMLGGGDFTWNGTNLTFTQTIRIYSPNALGDALILTASSPITLSSDRDIAYITLSRSSAIDYTATITVVADGSLPVSNNVAVVATRISSNKVLLKNGQVVFNGDQALEHGEIDSSRVTFDPSGTALSSTDLQSALAELDTIVSGISGSALPSGTLIMFNGAVCPAGTTAVPGVVGAYPKFAAAANLTPTGSNSHTHPAHSHGGSTNSAGSHSHTLENHDFLDFSFFANGVTLFSFDAWYTGDNNLSNFSTQSAGSHSHTIASDSVVTPSASSEPQNISVLLCVAT